MLKPPPLGRVALGAMLAATAVWGCSDGGTTNPPTPVPTTITLNKTSVTFDALTATDQLTATVKDQNGNTMASAVTWSSSNASVASVSGSGLVAAVANGSAQVTATAGSANGSATVTVSQAPSQMAKVAGDAQTATVGQQLATDLVAQVNDRLGNAMSGVMVNFTVSQDGGSAAPASGMTDGSGQITTQWTLGTVAGAHTATATPATGSGSAAFAATADADVADSVFKLSGDGQTGTVGGVLAMPIVVKVVDQYGNAVEGHTVAFTPGANFGSAVPPTDDTDVDGEASTSWQLGGTAGAQSLEANAGGLKDDPLTFDATATTLSVTNVSPDTIVEGTTAVITGTGFSPTPANNVVSVDGVTAIVTAATATTLDVTVPTFDCQPARNVDIQVTVSSSPANLVSQPLSAANPVDLAAGEMLLIDDPAAFCLQFGPSSTDPGQYLVGVSAAAEQPTTLLPVMMTGVLGASPSAPAFPSAPVAARYAAGSGTVLGQEEFERRVAHLEAEQRLRAWEREHLDPATNPALRSAIAASPVRSAGMRSPAGTMAVPDSGDVLHLHVPDLSSGNVCDSIPIDAVVKNVGNSGIFVTDINNPATDSLTDAEIVAYSDTFDVNIYNPATTYFGVPSDLDTNLRVIVVLTIEVNKLVGGAIAGFVFSGDLFAPASCATSDFGELFYGHVPDPANAAGTVGRTKSSVLAQMPSLIAHEFTHIIQQSRRLILVSGNNLSSWEAEGQATLSEEVVAHSFLGNQSGMDYGASTAFTGPAFNWYTPLFQRLSWYYGKNGGANAPEECTLFGSQSINDGTTPCQAFWFYGASWSFQRYVVDRFGPSYTGGEAALTRDWIDASPSSSGVPNVEALLGQEFDSVFAQWAAMHYVDGKVANPDPIIEMTSWDLEDVMNGNINVAPLAPVSGTFGDFNLTETIRGGSTYYQLLSSGDPRPALAVRLRDLAGQVLSTAMRPQYWVVRVQ